MFDKLGRDALFQMLIDEAKEGGPSTSRLQDGEALPVTACLRPWFSLFYVKYSSATTVRYFKHDGTYVDVVCATVVHQPECIRGARLAAPPSALRCMCR